MSINVTTLIAMPSDILQSPISDGAKILYLYLALLRSIKGSSHIALSEIVEVSSMSLSSIHRRLKELEDAGDVGIIRHEGYASDFYLAGRVGMFLVGK